jgi:hypothetical protein
MGDPVELIRRRHPEWAEHHRRWAWLLDSLEGGERYREAVYGYDAYGFPVRNLVRHKREYPASREAATAAGGSSPFPTGTVLGTGVLAATDDDYELRRTRTPVPTFLAEAVETHVARIYAREVQRDAPEAVRRFWADVDGAGTTIDLWMAETVAPLLLVLGQLDLCVDFPAAGAPCEDGPGRPVASVILPQDMVWWRLDPTGCHYEECLVLQSGDGPGAYFRHWTATRSTLYAADGAAVEVVPHEHGRVPIVRVFDRRKPRCRNIGQSRYEGIAERQREYYNRDSELILSDTTQAHPLLQGPEDYIQPDGTIPVGPSWLLPKKKNTTGTTATYEGFDVLGFPKDGAESIRRNKADLRDDVDRDSSLVRPAGRASSVQSGLSKLLDHLDANHRLAKLAKVLANAERAASGLARAVLGDAAPGEAPIVVVYPTDFELFTADDLATAAARLQALVARAGALPETEGLLIGRVVRLCLPGLADEAYGRCEAELRAYLADQSRRRERHPEDVGAPGPEQSIFTQVNRW